MNNCKIIAVANQKGGVGKTSIVYCLSSVMAAQGKKVLCVDLDGQGSLTLYCKMQGRPTIMQALETHHLPTFEVFPGVMLTPADKILSLDSSLTQHNLLKRLLDEQRTKYDFILCDLSPSVSMVHFETMCASDYVLIPSLPSVSALSGVDAMTEYLATVAKTTGHSPKILGVVLSRIRNLNIHKFVVELYRKEYPELLINTTIPECCQIDEAQTLHQSLIDYAPKGKATAAFKALYDELITRL